MVGRKGLCCERLFGRLRCSSLGPGLMPLLGTSNSNPEGWATQSPSPAPAYRIAASFGLYRDRAWRQSRTVKWCSPSIKSGVVSLWSRINGMTLLRIPMPRASM